MQINGLLKYFLFLRSHWNLRLALFTIVHEIKGENKYGINTFGVNDLKNTIVKGDHKKHAYIYQPASYFLLQKSFNFLSDHFNKEGFVDFGCGKGRALAVAAFYGFKKITGVDFSEDFCLAATQNNHIVKEHFPETRFQIHCMDATDYLIQRDDTVFFFFNPFDDVVMLKVAKNILASQKEFPREIVIVYFNPLFLEIFLAAGFEEVYSFCKLEYLEVSILVKPSEI